jgi:2-polyprenyl-3-methyl-5-hydroxy-6-metoxy-1,4-benzoquinol methylase
MCQVPAANVESVRCPLCGAPEHSLLYDFSPYLVVRCLSCGADYLSPRLIESSTRRLYEGDNYFRTDEVGYKGYLQQEQSLRYSFQRLLRQLKRRRLTGGALLEVGCGYGYFLDEAHGYFQDRRGIDLSLAAVASTRPLADYVYHGDVTDIPAADRFDCIVLVSVIEHVYKPVEFLRQLLSHLKPGGTVVIATPNAGSIYRRWLGRRWPAFQVIPEHVAFYSRKTLSRTMRQAGLVSIVRVPYSRAYPANQVVDEFGLWPSILKHLGQRNIVFPGYMVALCGRRPGSR